MSETPRTDAEGLKVPGIEFTIVRASLAEELERELNQWRECAEELACVLTGHWNGGLRHMKALAKFDALKKKRGSILKDIVAIDIEEA